MYRDCAIYLFTVVLLASCGTPIKTGPENLQAELDTAFYNKYIEKGPDTNLYPVFMYASSQRTPTQKFGLHSLFDGNMDSWWSSNTGLNTGEYVELHFNNLGATSCKIHISDDMIMARIGSVS